VKAAFPRMVGIMFLPLLRRVWHEVCW